MCSKAEWKACAERRLAENLALRTLIEQMNQQIEHYYRDGHKAKPPGSLVTELRTLVHTAKEVGK